MLDRRAAVGAMAGAGVAAAVPQGSTASGQSQPLNQQPAAVSVTEFGAIGDGVQDDSAAINAALAGECSRVHIPDGLYRLSSPILLDASVSLVGSPRAILQADPGLPETIRIGSRRLFNGVVSNVIVRGGTDDVPSTGTGFAFHNMAEASFYDCEASGFDIGFLARPGTEQRVAYCTWVNAQGLYNRLNFTMRETDNGFVNENVFFGGRAHGEGNTETHVFWPGGNHNRFIAMSCEGNSKQAFYMGGHSNVIFHCRTEGEWEIDDIVIAKDALYTYVSAITLYTSVTDNGTNSRVETGLQGASREIGFGGTPVEHLRRLGSSTNGVPVLELADLGTSGDGAGLRSTMTRYTKDSYHLRCQRAPDGQVVAEIDSRGRLFAAQRLIVGRAKQNGGGLVIGTNQEWYDENGVKRLSDLSQGQPREVGAFGIKVDPPASSNAPGRYGDWAADGDFIYAYAGDGTRHRWVRSRVDKW